MEDNPTPSLFCPTGPMHTMFRTFASFASAFALATLLLAPMAARAVQPESGMWNLDGEITGKPGRGLQIDSQDGRYLIVTYFGYRDDGSSLFLQASGRRSDDGRFAGELLEFEGGRVLAGSAKDGRTRRVVGNIALWFDSSTTGQIVLPGEPPVRIVRFQYEDHTARFANESHTFTATRSSQNTPYLEPISATFRLKDGNFHLRTRHPENPTGTWCNFNGTYQAAGKGLRAEGVYDCAEGSPKTGSFVTDELVLDQRGSYRAVIVRTPQGASKPEAPDFHYGVCGIFPVFLAPYPRCSFQ